MQDVLQEEGEKMLRYQGTRISKVVKNRTGTLMNSRSMSVSGDDSDGTLTFTHVIYERFLDMKRLGKRKKGKRRKIHNRFTYGMYSTIIRRLMYGFTDEVRKKFQLK